MTNSFSNLNIRWHFRNESERARQLATECPKYWEYLLTEQLLHDWQIKWKLVFDLQQTTSHSGRVFTCETEFIYWALTQMFKILDWLSGMLLPVICKELSVTWGAPGEPGNAIQIKKCILKLDKICKKTIGWKLEVMSAKFPTKYERLRSIMMGWELLPIAIVEDFYLQLSAAIVNFGGQSNQRISMTLENLPRMTEFNLELEECARNSVHYNSPETLAQKSELDRLKAITSTRQFKY